MPKDEAVSVVGVMDSLIEQAHQGQVSDIHIDPTAKDTRIRMRIDGVLQETHTFPKAIHPEIISRIKVLARLRTDEHQAAQDGRFRHLFPNSEFVDVRVSI